MITVGILLTVDLMKVKDIENIGTNNEEKTIYKAADASTTAQINPDLKKNYHEKKLKVLSVYQTQSVDVNVRNTGSLNCPGRSEPNDQQPTDQ